MPFQPFGYRFQVDLPLRPTSAKATIRQRMKPWFEAKSGARGWIVGPFVCLWLRALDRHGPMLFGMIRNHGLGTRITGRAGSNLNGIAWFVVLAVLAIAVAGLEVASGASDGGTLIALGLFLLFLPLMLWMSHRDRRDAEPLVRFLEEILSGPRPKRRLEFDDVVISAALKLDIDGEVQQPPLTAARIAEALQSIESEEGYLILSSADEIYIQTAAVSDGFVIEKREGSSVSHVEAVRNDAPESAWLKKNFTFDETLETLLAYASGAPAPAIIKWWPM